MFGSLSQLKLSIYVLHIFNIYVIQVSKLIWKTHKKMKYKTLSLPFGHSKKNLNKYKYTSSTDLRLAPPKFASASMYMRFLIYLTQTAPYLEVAARQTAPNACL